MELPFLFSTLLPMSKFSQDLFEKQRQEKTEGRFTLRLLFADVWHDILTLGRKTFFFTIFQLAFRPASSIRRVIEGYRKYLQNPLEFLALAGTLVALFNTRYHFFESSYSPELSNLFQNLGKAFIKDFLVYSGQYPTLVNVIAIPVFTGVSYVFFLKNPFNFAENLIMNTYIAAQQMLFLLLFLPLLEFFPSLKTSFFIPTYNFLILSYNIWVYVRFFGGSLRLNLPKAVLAVLVAYVLQVPFNAFFYYLFHPYADLFDKFF
jgi:hypothetical protein